LPSHLAKKQHNMRPTGRSTNHLCFTHVCHLAWAYKCHGVNNGVLPLQWFIHYYSPRWYVAFDFLISVADHQRAFIVHICTQHLMMCIQDAEDWVACLSRAQLIHLCTGVPDLTPRPTEMAQILEPIRSSQSVSFVLPGGPVQVSVFLFISHPCLKPCLMCCSIS